MCWWGINRTDCFGAGITMLAVWMQAQATRMLTCLRQATSQFNCGTIATLNQEIAAGPNRPDWHVGALSVCGVARHSVLRP